jgi:hypothetical protein
MKETRKYLPALCKVKMCADLEEVTYNFFLNHVQPNFWPPILYH